MQIAFMATNKEIGARIKQARIAAGFPRAAAAAEALGVVYATYAAHENGSRDASGNITLYARRYGVSTDWLLTRRGAGPKGSDAAPSDDGLGPPIAVGTEAPSFAGIAQAGLFRPVDEYFNQDESWEMPAGLVRYPGYPRLRQYTWLSQGNSMVEAGIHDGQWIVGADAGDYVDQVGDIESGDLVVVERTRYQGSERELTVKEIHYFRDRYELRPRSSDPQFETIVVPHDHNGHDDFEVKIVGVVLTAFTDLRKGRRVR